MGRVILTSATFDPDTSKMLGQAFDEAWQQTAGRDQSEAMLEDRRQRLASIILGLADGGVRDLEQIIEAATRLMTHGEEPGHLNGQPLSTIRIPRL